MTPFIHTVCGTQFEPSEAPPARCPVCADERQYETDQDPQWVAPAELASSHWNTVREIAPGRLGIGIAPEFAIGQRAVLLLRPGGNVLWDCVPLLDPALVRLAEAAGGVSAIAISHPHYYSAMVDWSRAFGDVPVYLHQADRAWVMRPDPAVRFWSGERHALADDLTLVRCGGHFPGATVLHDAAERTLYSGDVIQVVPDTRWVSFMYSYPNLVPLSAEAVGRVVASVEGLAFDRIVGAFWDRVVAEDAQARLRASAERYVRALRGDWPPAEPDCSLIAPAR